MVASFYLIKMIDENKYPVLSRVDSPADLKEMELADLKQLCTDVREYMIDTILGNDIN